MSVGDSYRSRHWLWVWVIAVGLDAGCGWVLDSCWSKHCLAIGPGDSCCSRHWLWVWVIVVGLGTVCGCG